MFGKKEKGEPRFIVKEQQELGHLTMTTLHVLLDTRTGVNYLLATGSAGSQITPLLDENGDVVVDKSIPSPLTTE